MKLRCYTIIRLERATGKGLTVMTGCSHPGLENILRKTSRFGSIYGVAGGFHYTDKPEVLTGMHLIVPCHHTTCERQILNNHSESSVSCSGGCVVEI